MEVHFCYQSFTVLVGLHHWPFCTEKKHHVSVSVELLNFLHSAVHAISVVVTGVIKLALINFHFSKKKGSIIKGKGAHI